MSRMARTLLTLLLFLAGACAGPAEEGAPDGSDGSGPDALDIRVADGDTAKPLDLVAFDAPDTPPDVADAVPPDLDGVDPGPELPDLFPDGPLPDLWDVPEVADGSEPDIEAVEPDVPPPPCIENEPCDDLDDCTVGDTCIDGLCQGEPYECDDGRPCTLDTCDGLGNCDYTLMVGKCLINGICAKSGEKSPFNQCFFCYPTQDPFAWSQQQFSPCDDGDACTVNDQCVDGECVGDTTVCDDGNPCTWDQCDPAVGCLHPPANIACDDGDPCTGLDFCQDGECQGGFAPPCNDNNPCTADSCQPGKGCFYAALNGEPCDDNDACTIGDFCQEATCIPGAEKPVCDDWNDCTDDICDPLVGCTFPLNGNPCCINDVNICNDDDPCTIDTCNVDTGACIYLPNEGSCSDKDACTENDTCVAGVCSGEPVDCDDANPCTLDFCNKAVGCMHESLNLDCDDGSVCTLNDQCVNGQCTGTPLNCNDYNLCTDDLCDPVTGCQNLFNDAPCNDFDLCTAGDQCIDGECVGTPKACDDDNPCTDDWCDPGVGCQNLFNEAPCSDGDECTEGDQCAGGQCVPGEVVCLSCDYAFDDAVNRVREMVIATDAKPGNALDLNDDGSPDNSMAGIGGIANEPLQGALDEGSIHLLLEHHGLKTNGSVYTVAVFVGHLAPGFEACDYASAYCGYTASEEALDPEACEAMVQFDNASIFQGKLVAGGPEYEFPWQVPLSEETVLPLTLYAARIEADVTVQQGLVTSINGIIGGAIPKQTFLDAINAVPAEQLPLPKEMIVQLIQALVVNDIDTDGNGVPDAASIAIQFDGIAGGIIGLE